MKKGQVIGECHRRHRSIKFRKFLNKIDDAVPADLDIHLILDNHGTLKTRLVQRWLAKWPRYHLHFTPACASLINQVEHWFAGLTEKQLRHSAPRSTREMELAIERYLETTNRHAQPFQRTKTADVNSAMLKEDVS